ncbi:MAG: ATP-binding protein [Bacteroidia bacterium]
MKSLSFLILGLLSCLWTMGQGDAGQSVSPVYQINSFQHEIDLHDFTDVMFDAPDKLSPEAIIAGEVQKPWRSLKSARTNKFHSDSLPWARISIQNNLDEPTLWNLTFNYIADSIFVYIVDQQGSVERFLVGKTVTPSRTHTGIDFLDEHYDSKMPVFFRLKNGEPKTIYYQTYNTTNGSTWLVPKLRSLENIYFHQSEQRGRYVKAFFYQGMIWMFILLNLLIFFFYKDKSYLYLALYALCFSFPNDISSVAYAVKTWMPEMPFMVSFRWVVLNPLVYVTASLFMRSYLNTKSDYPRSDRYLSIMIGIGWIYLAASVINYILTDRNAINNSFVYSAGMSVIAAVIFVLVFLDLYKVKKTNIRFWLAGMIWLLVFHLIPVIPMLLGNSEFSYAVDSFFHPFAATGIGVLGQIFIFTLGLGFQSREIAQEKETLQSRDELKSRFFANISHEFRTPLTLVLGPLAQLIEKAKDPEEKQLLTLAHRNASRQLELVNQILDLSKLESGKMKLQAQERDFIPALKGMVFSYESLAEQRDIQLVLDCDDEEVMVFVDKEKIETIFYNLLSNSFKFTPDGGIIAVRQYANANSLGIQISDTGVGIAKEKLDHIFDRFFQAETGLNEQEGTGIGLALVKELVALHGGTISVHSEVGEGTAFTIKLPRGKAHLSPEDIIQNDLPEVEHFVLPAIDSEELDVLEKSDQDNGLPHLLIIEDNADMRAFIRQGLEGMFHISEAIDGEDGIAQAVADLPDLIISDVMMPKKDGYEVCKILKQDVRTSHIPVVLLTAKAAPEAKLEGLDTGADDYVIKPFDAKELATRARNLIQLRKQLRSRFAESVLLQPSEVTTNSIDTEFLEKALAIVEANMNNEAFSIDILSTEIGMSKANLNRKLRALTSQSTNKFIQSIRLQRAADLLKQKAGTVSDIAFQTGFSSTAYFVKCFKDQFGVTPGNYGDAS